MQPQPPQIEKIAAALNVSYSALNGVFNAKESDTLALEELLAYKNGIELELQSST